MHAQGLMNGTNRHKVILDSSTDSGKALLMVSAQAVSAMLTCSTLQSWEFAGKFSKQAQLVMAYMRRSVQD